MVAEISPTRRIAEFVAETKLGDVPAAAIEGAKLSILDSFGCGLAALEQPVAQAILAYVESLGGQPVATVLGAGGFKTAAPLAALANGCLVNVLDFDGYFHVPTHTLPAALAVGEMIGATGAEVLEAYLVAAEVADGLQKVIEARRSEMGGPTFRGWYHVSLYGPLTASLAAGKLLKLDVPHLQGAMGAAACGSGGYRQNLGARAKSFNSGNAASVGVHAAFLAQHGVTGDPTILEARVGLVNAVCLPGEYDWEPVMSRLGNPYEFESARGTKKYPAVGPTQSVIGTLAHLKETSRFSADEVDWIEARLSTFSASYAEPEDELSAGFCWPYILAATVADGSFRVDHLSRASIEDPRIRDLSTRVRLVPPSATGEQEQVVVHLRDGRALEAPIEARFGRLSGDGLMAKYRDNAGRRLPPSEVDRLQQQVMGLDGLVSIHELTATLAGPGPSP